MQIIYAANIRFPMERANSIQITHTCAALARAGVKVRLVVRRTCDLPTKQCLSFYGLTPHPNLIVHRLPVLNTHWSLALWNRSYTLATLAWLLTAARLSQPDLILLRDLSLARILLKYKGLFDLPVVYESHEISHVIYRNLHTHLPDCPQLAPEYIERIERSERYVYQHADAVVTITHALADAVEQTFGRRAMVSVVPDAAACPSEPTEAQDIGRRLDSIYYIGQLYPWKGVDTLVRAMPRLASRRLVIVGGLPYESDRTRLESLSRDLGVADRVTFTGFVPPAQVREHLSRAAVAVLPLPDNPMARRFTSPLKLFEYMAAGVPIVASDLPSLREVLRDGENALLVAPGDPEALARGIDRLLSDRALSARLADQARKDVAAYTWPRRAQSLCRIFEDVLARQDAPPQREDAR